MVRLKKTADSVNTRWVLSGKHCSKGCKMFGHLSLMKALCRVNTLIKEDGACVE